jgi:hypothetical protein
VIKIYGIGAPSAELVVQFAGVLQVRVYLPLFSVSPFLNRPCAGRH